MRKKPPSKPLEAQTAVLGGAYGRSPLGGYFWPTTGTARAVIWLNSSSDRSYWYMVL